MSNNKNGKIKVKSSKVVMIGDTPLTPEVSLSQLQDEISEIDAIVHVIFYNKPDGKRVIEVQWSDMKVYDLACAAIVLDMRMRGVMDDTGNED